jgi:hypothetical protein
MTEDATSWSLSLYSKNWISGLKCKPICDESSVFFSFPFQCCDDFDVFWVPLLDTRGYIGRCWRHMYVRL